MSVKIILSKSQDANSSLFKLRLPRVHEVMYFLDIASKSLPFFITIFTVKCLISHYNDEPAAKYFAYSGMILYHSFLSCLKQNSPLDIKSRLLIAWNDVNFHRLVFIILTLFLNMTPYFSFLQYSMVFFHKALRIFDADIVNRTGEVSPALHQFNRNMIRSLNYQRVRAILEFLWFPYIVMSCVLSFEIEKIVFLYFYFIFIVLFDFQFDEMHQWIWLQIDQFFTMKAFEQPEDVKAVLLKTLYIIRKLGTIGKMVYPLNEEVQ